jgi:hypothetical protein
MRRDTIERPTTFSRWLQRCTSCTETLLSSCSRLVYARENSSASTPAGSTSNAAGSSSPRPTFSAMIRPYPKDGDTRSVPLSSKAIEILKRRIEGRDLKSGCGVPHTDGATCTSHLVFRNADGGVANCRPKCVVICCFVIR